MLAGVDVEHEVSQGAFEAGANAVVNCKARPGNLRRALEIQNAQARAEVPVGLGRKTKFPRSAPAPDFLVVQGAPPDGHARMRHVGQAGE